MLSDKGDVTLCNFPCNLSRNLLRCSYMKGGLTPSNVSCNLSRDNFGRCNVGYSVQWFMQLVSRWFWPLQSMLQCAMVRATCLAMILAVARYVTLCNGTCNLSRNDFGHCKVCYIVQWLRATCLAMILAVAKYVTLCNGYVQLVSQWFWPLYIRMLQCVMYVQLVSQWVWPLEGALHCVMVRATCLAMILAVAKIKLCNGSCNLSSQHRCETITSCTKYRTV